MSIIIRNEIHQFQLNTNKTSYIMSLDSGYLTHLYWGARLPDEDHTFMYRPQGRASFSCTMEDNKAPLLEEITLEYPAWGRGDLRPCAIEIINSDGSNIVDLHYIKHEIIKGKPSIKGLPSSYTEKGDKTETLVITLKDAISNILVELYYAVFEDYDVIARWSKIINNSKETVEIARALSACADFDSNDFDVITNYGTHARERYSERTELCHRTVKMSSRRGSSSHQHNPFLILTSHDCTEELGEAYGMTLVYSGNFTADCIGDQYHKTRLMIGLNPEGFGWQLKSGDEFLTPEALITYSNEGIGGMSINFNRLIRDRVCRGKYRNKRRPVLLNTWEGCFFSFDEKKLVDIGECIAKLGVEMLVVDDGWFGRRDNDTSSLGDWFVDKRKLPNGIEGLYDKIHSQGLMLGIWFEPEMISPNSDLYRAHPDWCLHIDNRPRSVGRQQLMLNLSRQDVCDYLYDCIADVLKTGNVDYIKWDFNRNMAEVSNNQLPKEQQKEVSHRYYLGLYSLLERLVTDFPEVLFESCSGGGGRFDAGMLHYMPQTWTSDNTDPIERLKIQHGTSLIYPQSSMSAHVSKSPNCSGHYIKFDTRFAVAFTGSFGYEFNPLEFSDKDNENIRTTTEIYKKYGEDIVNGDYYRLEGPYNSKAAAWCNVSKDKSVVVATYLVTEYTVYNKAIRLKLRGIDKQAKYKDVNNGKIYSGEQLIHYGIPVNNQDEYVSQIFYLEKVTK